MLLALALACAPRAEPPAPEEAAVVEPTDVLLGVVHRDGVKACREGAWEIEWHHLFWEAGFVPLVGDDAAIEPHHGKPVLVRGRPADASPHSRPLPPGYTSDRCPIPQMRSDMVESPDGMRLRRHERPLDAFEVASIEPFTGLAVTRDGDRAVLKLTNTLGTALSEVELVAHYEGCYGKPGTKTVRAGVAALDPDASFYRLFSVELRAKGDRVWFDFDARLSELGAEPIQCPEDRP